MSDILDVMNIKSFPAKKSKEQQQPQQSIAELRQIYQPEEYASNAKRRKLSAMNRELYNLIGSNVPPLAIDTASVANAGSGKKFKEKLLNNKTNAPWRRLGFKNSARDDELVLYHWTKATSGSKPASSGSEISTIPEEKATETTKDDKETAEGEKEKSEKEDKMDVDETPKPAEEELDPNEYRYAKYNTQLQIPSFTEEEYDEAMKVEEEKRQKEAEIKEAKEKVKLEKEAAAAAAENATKSKTKETPDAEGKESKKENEDSATESKSNSDTPAEEKTEETDDASKDSKTPTPTIEDEKADEENKTDEAKEGEKVEEVKARPWTYEETQFLFDLCNDYDMRWAVIFDRYQDKYSDRILEDLKVQMYSLSAYLLEKKGNLNDSALIKALRSFNKDKELERKYYLTKLIHRAPTEIAEEESLVIEARKFELAAKKMLLERAQLLQLLDSPQSSASVQQYLTSQGLTQLYNSLMSTDKSKKRKAEVPVAPLLGPNAIPHTQHLQMSSSSTSGNAGGSGSSNNANKRRSNGSVLTPSGGSKSGTSVSVNAANTAATTSSSSNANKTPSKLSEVQQLLQKNLTPEELEVYGIEIHTDRIQPGVHVRSQKIASFKPSVQAKVHEILGQLGLSVKPTIPTGPVSKRFDELLYKIAHLVDLKKQSDKLLAEIELVKRQKGLL